MCAVAMVPARAASSCSMCLASMSATVAAVMQASCGSDVCVQQWTLQRLLHSGRGWRRWHPTCSRAHSTTTHARRCVLPALRARDERLHVCAPASQHIVLAQWPSVVADAASLLLAAALAPHHVCMRPHRLACHESGMMCRTGRQSSSSSWCDPPPLQQQRARVSTCRCRRCLLLQQAQQQARLWCRVMQRRWSSCGSGCGACCRWRRPHAEQVQVLSCVPSNHSHAIAFFFNN